MPDDRSCPACGGETPAGSRFCPHCGTRLADEAGSTAVIEPPPDETGPVPVRTETVEPHLFGVTPPLALLALALVAFAVGAMLVVVGARIAGSVVLVAAVLLLVAFVRVARRKPGSGLARVSAGALDRGRERVAVAAGSLATRSRARRELARLRAERLRLEDRRRELQLALGGAVYEGDDAATESLRAELAELDRAVAGKEAEMERVVAQAREQVQHSRLEVQPTEMVEVPGTPSTPEPAPAPGGPTPPEPARIPEPYPPPGEADPPEPARIPEPYPPPDEGDPPEPARIPEPGGDDRP